MSSRRTALLAGATLTLVVGSLLWAGRDVVAQVSPPTPPPKPGDPYKSIPEKMEPPASTKQLPERVPPAPPGSLSDKLGKNQGVLTPPKGIDPEIQVPAPVPNPGTTPVIPPPGAPGNPSPVIPK